MKVDTLTLDYRADWSSSQPAMQFHHLSDDPSGLCEATGTHQCMNLEATPILNEATYKEITTMIDGNFLNQKIRSDALAGVSLGTIEDNILRYIVDSSEFASNRIQYQCSVLFDEWDEINQDTELNYAEKARMLLWVGNIRLHCTCPSFLYHGYQYLLAVIDAAIYDEVRKPVIKNPGERGIVCKHMNRILTVLPFYSGKIATELKRQNEG